MREKHHREGKEWFVDHFFFFFTVRARVEGGKKRKALVLSHTRDSFTHDRRRWATRRRRGKKDQSRVVVVNSRFSVNERAHCVAHTREERAFQCCRAMGATRVAACVCDNKCFAAVRPPRGPPRLIPLSPPPPSLFPFCVLYSGRQAKARRREEQTTYGFGRTREASELTSGRRAGKPPALPQ